jgi:hypothetical protein
LAVFLWPVSGGEKQMAKANQSSKRGLLVREKSEVTRQIARLAKLGDHAVRLLAARQIGVDVEGQDASLLRLRLSYELQVDAYGDLRQATKHRLRQIHRRLQLDPGYAPKPHYGLAVGTVLERKWQGVTHRVAVTHDGFEYQSSRFRTLSEVARQITGTRWSGPLFFGLRKGGLK